MTTDVSAFISRIRACANRDEAAQVYAEALATMSPASKKWPTLNRETRRKWTLSGLNQIKQRAWKLLAARVNESWERTQ